MKKIVVLAIIVSLYSAGCYSDRKKTVFGGKDRTPPIFTEDQKTDALLGTFASDTTDIHYSSRYCLECHESSPKKGGNKSLRFGGDFKILCRCHYNTSANYVHPVDIVPSEEITPRIPAEFPLKDGQVSCSTCHDIVVQCRDNQVDRIFLKEQKFLRGAPLQTKTSICFRCHDAGKYQMYNPHNQLTKKNEIIEEKCLYCHAEIPDSKKTTLKDAKLIGNLQAMCARCHMRSVKQIFHANHLRQPSPQVLAQIKQMEDQYSIILPLGNDGQITCATCHNPHEKGVIPDKRSGAKGASEARRHRLSGNMCIKCHPMK
jgi:hypothetical protein